VTCGNQSDPRIRLGVSLADELTLIFRSDNENQYKGVRLIIEEIDTTVSNSVYSLITCTTYCITVDEWW